MLSSIGLRPQLRHAHRFRVKPLCRATVERPPLYIGEARAIASTEMHTVFFLATITVRGADVRVREQHS